MKLALVTTPPSVRSGIGDYTRHLLPHLREHVELAVFVEDALAGEEYAGLPTRAASTLLPREHDQILFQLGNEVAHAFMAPMVRAMGGTVCLHDWVLFDLALAAWPALARGGLRGHWLALREGGSGELGVYRAHRAARRRARSVPLEGWHPLEQGGRWTGDGACLQVPADASGELRLQVRGAPGSRSRVSDLQGRTLAEASFGPGHAREVGQRTGIAALACRLNPHSAGATNQGDTRPSGQRIAPLKVPGAGLRIRSSAGRHCDQSPHKRGRP